MWPSRSTGEEDGADFSPDSRDDSGQNYGNMPDPISPQQEEKHRSRGQRRRHGELESGGLWQAWDVNGAKEAVKEYSKNA